MRLFNTYSEMILSSKSYMEFKNYLEEVDYCNLLKKYSNQATVVNADTIFKIKNRLAEKNVIFFFIC